MQADEITLGFFSFGKFLMYKGLDPRAWPESDPLAAHPGLAALLADGFREPESAFDDETNVDEVVSPPDVHQVVDADSSQTLAILDVNAGRNLVLQDPPGTGKSQTITNIIAGNIGMRRKVLFVSEKIAALEVVNRRFDQVGLAASRTFEKEPKFGEDLTKDAPLSRNPGEPAPRITADFGPGRARSP